MHELLKTRRILKCSYPYSFFLEPKSTKKEIVELMQVVRSISIHHLRETMQCDWFPFILFLRNMLMCLIFLQHTQTDLEMVTEDLAQKVNRPYLRTPRHKIITATYLVQQKRREFLASVARGVAPNDSPEAPRRR